MELSKAQYEAARTAQEQAENTMGLAGTLKDATSQQVAG